MLSNRNEAGSVPVTIKKYANRRLYNTGTSSYVTLDNLCHMVKDGVNFVVYDAKTGEDITRSVLTQIIVEEEAKGQSMLPISFLRQVIGLYGDSLGGLVPRYLEYSMQAFAQHEEQMRSLMQNALDGLFPFNQFEEMGKQNMAFFEAAMKMFAPFYTDGDTAKLPSSRQQQVTSRGSDAGTAEGLEEMRARLNAIQQQLDGLASKNHG